MANNVSINGATVDIDDPCALYKALNAIRVRILAGEAVTEVFQAEFNGQLRTRFKSPSLAELDRELTRLADLCAQASGGAKRRHAIRAGFRRYYGNGING